MTAPLSLLSFPSLVQQYFSFRAWPWVVLGTQFCQRLWGCWWAQFQHPAPVFSVTEDFYRYKSIDFCVWLLSFMWEPNQAWTSLTFLMQATSPQMNSALKYSFWWHILIALQLFLKLLWVLCLCCLYIFHRLLEHSLNQMVLRYHGDGWHYYGWPLSFGLGQQWLTIEKSIGCFCVRVCGCFKVLVWDGGCRLNCAV